MTAAVARRRPATRSCPTWCVHVNGDVPHAEHTSRPREVWATAAASKVRDRAIRTPLAHLSAWKAPGETTAYVNVAIGDAVCDFDLKPAEARRLADHLVQVADLIEGTTR